MKNASFKIAASAMLVASVFASQAYAANVCTSHTNHFQNYPSIHRRIPLKNASFKIAASAMLVASVFASQAYAAGFQLSEQSSIQMGRAMAGAGVMGDDLSAVHYNPAGMTLLEGTRIQATGTWVAVNAEYKGDKTGATENGRKKGQLVPARVSRRRARGLP